VVRDKGWEEVEEAQAGGKRARQGLLDNDQKMTISCFFLLGQQRYVSLGRGTSTFLCDRVLSSFLGSWCNQAQPSRLLFHQIIILTSFLYIPMILSESNLAPLLAFLTFRSCSRYRLAGRLQLRSHGSHTFSRYFFSYQNTCCDSRYLGRSGSRTSE